MRFALTILYDENRGRSTGAARRDDYYLSGRRKQADKTGFYLTSTAHGDSVTDIRIHEGGDEHASLVPRFRRDRRPARPDTVRLLRGRKQARCREGRSSRDKTGLRPLPSFPRRQGDRPAREARLRALPGLPPGASGKPRACRGYRPLHGRHGSSPPRRKDHLRHLPCPPRQQVREQAAPARGKALPGLPQKMTGPPLQVPPDPRRQVRFPVLKKLADDGAAAVVLDADAVPPADIVPGEDHAELEPGVRAPVVLLEKGTVRCRVPAHASLPEEQR